MYLHVDEAVKVDEHISGLSTPYVKIPRQTVTTEHVYGQRPEKSFPLTTRNIEKCNKTCMYAFFVSTILTDMNMKSQARDRERQHN